MSNANKDSMPEELARAIDQTAPESRNPLGQVWTLLDQVPSRPLNVPDLEDAWRDLQTRLDAPPAGRRAAGRPPVARSRPRRTGWLVAYSLVLVLVAGLWAWHRPVTVRVPAGVQSTVHLPDGSTVELNSGTRLEYTRRFQPWPFVDAEQRRVTLDGEGFFDITPSERPFLVATFNAQVEVLGTRFNVRARPEEAFPETNVTLASGRVRVAARFESGPVVRLDQTGDVARVSGPTVTAPPPQNANLDQVLAWRQQGFSAIYQPLETVVAEIERRYALELEIQDGIALDDSLFLFYHEGVTAEQILHDLCLSQGCRFRQTSRGFTLYP